MKKRLAPGWGILFVFCTFILTTLPGFSQSTSGDLLNHLEGKWIMSGSVMGKQVLYIAEGNWVLQNKWLCLHMKDTLMPAEYEADVYMGIDSAKNEYVGHWLDSFGGAGARVTGIGPVSSGKIEIVYPYAEGKFRNLFIFNSLANKWDFVIESEEKDGSWTNFANFSINAQIKE
jgi:hypothetical protein